MLMKLGMSSTTHKRRMMLRERRSMLIIGSDVFVLI